GRTEQGSDVLDVEDALLDKRIDRLSEALFDDGRDRLRRLADEALAVVGVRRGQRVRREIRHRDVDGRIRLRACEKPKLPQLLAGLETVSAFHLDRRRAELGGVAD